MVLKYLHIILLASVKYFVTLPYAMIIGLDYKQAVIAMLIGGIGGFLFFYYLSKRLIRGIDIVWPYICRFAPPFYRYRYKAICEKQFSKKPVKIFTRKNRLIAKIRTRYGLWGIIFSTPFLLTIPVGAFLVSKYYSRQKHIVLYMILSIIGWAGILSGIVHLFPNVFF
ncbi:hypothetical protein N9164_03475 [Draconibacterium sp.]|nr:hypothetical protein [Draconibacterium sp.]